MMMENIDAVYMHSIYIYIYVYIYVYVYIYIYIYVYTFLYISVSISIYIINKYLMMCTNVVRRRCRYINIYDT